MYPLKELCDDLSFMVGFVVLPIAVGTLVKVTINAIQRKQLSDYKFMLLLLIMIGANFG